jgi:hypothetical protein
VTRDEFDLWKKDPVTKWVFAALERAEDANRAEWIRQSWDNGKADEAQLIELRSATEAMSEIRLNDFERWSEWNGEEVSDD